MTPKILEPQCAWHSDEVSDESAFTETFEGAELEEIDGALRAAMEKSEDVLEIGREDFPLKHLEFLDLKETSTRYGTIYPLE